MNVHPGQAGKECSPRRLGHGSILRKIRHGNRTCDRQPFRLYRLRHHGSRVGFFRPVFGFSETWQLVINTGTTIVTFLMVFLIQNTQNRDGAALQAKLDEIILFTDAENEFVGIEKLTDKELDALHARCEKAARRSSAMLQSDMKSATQDGSGRSSRFYRCLKPLASTGTTDVAASTPRSTTRAGNAHFPSAAPSSAFMKKASVCAGSATAQSLHELELERLCAICG